MKKLLFLSISVLFTISLFGQFTPEPCNGNQQKSLDLLEKAAIFNVAGINLNKYDWKHPDINCHINSAISERKKAGTFKYLGATGIGLGAGALVSGGVNASVGVGDGGGGLIAAGVALIGGGIYSMIVAKKKKKKSNYHLNQVSEYYQQNRML